MGLSDIWLNLILLSTQIDRMVLHLESSNILSSLFVLTYIIYTTPVGVLEVQIPDVAFNSVFDIKIYTHHTSVDRCH